MLRDYFKLEKPFEPLKPKTQVCLFFRKANPTGNVSIENSFETMQTHFPNDSRFKLVPFKSSYYSVGFLPRLRAILEVRKKQTDINHVTGDTNFFVLGLPRQKTVLTIHDCGFLEGKKPLARWILLTFWLKLPVRQCKVLTVISEATKQDVLAHTNCSPDKIVVIPTVIKQAFTANIKVFNKNCPTLLHIGNSPNKNLARHAAALSGLNCRLHVIGKISISEIEMLKRFNFPFEISYNLSLEEMNKAYQEADILLFCSTIEGFGMPILEAQTVGRVVITSNISSMPEVAGEGACLVDPLSISDIRTTIERVCQDDGYRNNLIQKGFENVKRFNPETVARQYEAVYEQVYFGFEKPDFIIGS
jgi:glycosyltransferase involved in cell wall biosynthesis